MVYFVIIIFLLWLTYLYDYKKTRRGYQLSFIITLLIFICLAGFRYKVGGDTTMYMKFFDQLHPLNSLTTAEFVRSRFSPGFVLLASGIKSLTKDYTFFQLFHSIVVNCVIFLFIRKNCTHVFFALLIFFNFLYFYLLFEQVRESFAVVIFLLAWPAFKKGIWWQWYIAAFFAFMFHISAFMMFFLPLICLPVIRNIFIFGKRTFYICGIAFVVAFILRATFFRYIEMIAVTEAMLDRAQAYGEFEREGILNIGHIVTSVIQFIAYPLLALYFLNKQWQKGKYDFQDNNTMVKEGMMVLTSIYISIFSIFIGILVRYNNYFYLFAILLMSDWIFTRLYLLRKFVKVGYLYWIFLFVPMFTVNFLNVYMAKVNRTGTLKTYMMYYPYSSILDQTNDENREKTVTYIRKYMK